MNRKFIIAALFLLFSPGFTSLKAQTADTLYGGQLAEVKIKSKWLNDTERYHYNQTKFYITTILPYLNASTALFNEINAKANDPHVSKREYKQFIARKQEQMKTQFEDKIKALNVTQGELLVKLIARQTDLNLYKMVAEVKNPIAAMKWQSWALVHGMNLDRKYHPEDEPMLENIMEELGYPLPASYAAN